MKRKHIAALILAASFGGTSAAWAIAPSQDAEAPTVRDHADQTHQQSDESPSSSNASDHAQSNRSTPTKHPPAAIMDRATPPEKSIEETGAAAQHPPSRVMERATPDQKTPASTEAQKSE